MSSRVVRDISTVTEWWVNKICVSAIKIHKCALRKCIMHPYQIISCHIKLWAVWTTFLSKLWYLSEEHNSFVHQLISTMFYAGQSTHSFLQNDFYP